jgi:hypothetical protein
MINLLINFMFALIFLFCLGFILVIIYFFFLFRIKKYSNKYGIDSKMLAFNIPSGKEWEISKFFSITFWLCVTSLLRNKFNKYFDEFYNFKEVKKTKDNKFIRLIEIQRVIVRVSFLIINFYVIGIIFISLIIWLIL